jgi:Ca-activated chloride channel family protein
MTLRILAAVTSLIWLIGQERPVFRSAAPTVYVYATVQGGDGRLVTDLTRDDFRIFDNDRAQTVTVFENRPQPITMAAMFDMSGSMMPSHERLRGASRAFIDALWPDDRVRIGSFGKEIALSPLLTNDKRVLRRIVDEELWPGGPTPLWLALIVAMNALPADGRRRVVLALTDGQDTGMARGPTAMPSVSAGDVHARAEREAFMIYAIGLQGTGLDGGMSGLAEDTGGGHFQVGKNDDLGRTFVQVVEELHHQYVIGFSPSVLDGRTHTLDVRTRIGGQKVRARKRYIASEAGVAR